MNNEYFLKHKMAEIKNEHEADEFNNENMEKEEELTKKLEEINKKIKEIEEEPQCNEDLNKQKDLYSNSGAHIPEMKKEKEEVRTETNQGHEELMLADQNRAVYVQSQNTLKFEKRTGTISTHGIMYEVKMTILIFLKLLNLGYSFFLCSNLDGAGDFDDIVVKYTAKDNTTETLFIQLKHAENDDKIRTLSFIMEKPYFDLHKYLISVCDSRIFNDPSHVIFNSDPSNVRYLIVTNADIDRKSLNNVTEISSFVHDITQHKGDVLKVNDDDEYNSFCNVLEKAINVTERKDCEYQLETEVSDFMSKATSNKLKKIVKCFSQSSVESVKERNKYKIISFSKLKHFISNTRVCCKQTNVNDLDYIIKNEITNALSCSCDETETVFNKLIDRVTIWWENETYYLTENCKLWYDIVRETEVDRFREREKELMNYGVKFKDEVVIQLRDKFLHRCPVINIVCCGDLTAVTTLKVWQALNYVEQQDYILVSINDCVENEQPIFKTWPNWWCKTLVIDYKEDCELTEQLIKKLQHKLELQPDSQVILVSSKSNCFQSAFKNSCAVVDVSTLHQLEEESKTKIFNKEINFQGENVSLSSLLEEKYLDKLSSDALTHLIVDDIFTLGEDFSRYKNKHNIERHLEIPYINGKILDKFENDTKIVLELESDEPTLNVNCNCVILNKGKEAEHFEELCNKYENVHWLKECKKTVTELEDVEEQQVYSENQYQYNHYLLWKKSKGNIETVKNYLTSSEMHIIDEERFITSDLQSPVIITGEPGMGKSDLLKKMAALLKKTNPTKWIVLVDLPQYCEYLDDVQDVHEDNVIEIIKKSLNLNNHSMQYFLGASTNLKNFIVLLDAFDEMSPYYTDKIKEFITHLVNDSFLLFITSRPCTVAELGKHTSSIPFVIQNFNQDETKRFLIDIFREKNEEVPEEILNIISNDDVTKIQTGLESFTTNPLHILMLAEIYNESGKSEKIKTLNILKMYTEFMKKKCEEFYKKMGVITSNPNAKNDMQLFIQRFFAYNKVIAVKHIFSEEMLKEFNIKKYAGKEAEAIHSLLVKVGVAEMVNNNTIKYVHRSYAEYFSALWLVENCSENETILNEIMQNNEMELVIMFYNLKNAENTEMSSQD